MMAFDMHVPRWSLGAYFRVYFGAMLFPSFLTINFGCHAVHVSVATCCMGISAEGRAQCRPQFMLRIILILRMGTFKTEL